MKTGFIILLLLIALPAHAQIIKSKTPSGAIHFTDKASKVPKGNTVMSVKPIIPKSPTTFYATQPSFDDPNPPRIISMDIPPFLDPSIKHYCTRLVKDGYSLAKTCVRQELLGRSYFRSTFIPKRIKKHCNSLVGESWARMKTCAIKEMRAKSYLGQPAVRRTGNRKKVQDTVKHVRKKMY